MVPFVNYEPPSARARLRSAEGKELRNNAEKSVLINEYFLDLFVPNGLVYDMFAGTGSMALACIKTHRNYVGSEPDREIHGWATQRMAKHGHCLSEENYLPRKLGVGAQ